MADRNLDIALRIKADMDAARGQVDAFNSSLDKTGKSATGSSAGLRAQTAELAKLLGQIDPTIKKLEELDRQQGKLQQAKKLGLIDDDGFARFNAAIEKERVGLDNAGKAMHSFSLNTANTRRELGFLTKDIATGQWGRLSQSGFTLANYSGLTGAAMSGTGLAVAGLAGVLGLFVAAAIKGQAESEALNKDIIATGNFAGVTGGQVRAMADTIGGTSGQADDAQKALRLLIASGQLTGRSLQEASQGALDFATVTGHSIEQAVQEFVKLREDPVKAVKALDDQYHFLTLTQYENIKALQAQGDAEAAADAAQTAASQALHARAVEVQNNVGLMEKAWDNLRSHVLSAWDAMKRVGTKTDSTDDFNNANKDLDPYRTRLAGIRHVDPKSITDTDLATASEIVLSRDNIKKLIAQKTTAQSGMLWEQWVAQTDADNKQLQDQGKKSSDVMTGYLKEAKSDQAKADEIKKVKEATAKLIATSPANTAQYKADETTALAYIEKKYAPPKGPKPKSDEAAQRAAIAAQAELIKMLGDMQGALDPTVKIWASYNDQVTKANDLAAKAKTAKGANIEAINAERDAYIATAGQVRDAALSDLADKDRAAFEKLRDSLRNVDGVTLGRVREQIAQLNAELKRGTITPDEYKDTTEAALNQGIKKLPTYKGVDGSVGGPFGELDKLDSQQKQLEDAYKADLDLLNAQHDAKLRSDQSFVDKENDLYKEHNANLAQLDQARMQVMIMGITSSLQQGADAIKQGFGAQSEAYRAAFALQKGAAIAMATVNMYMDISQASAKGWPQNIPLIAQAVGEGLSIIGSIRSLSAGYAEGGYTGPGGKYQVAGYVHAGEGVLSQDDMAALGGPAAFEAFRRGLHGYADGGYVNPLANVPAPSSSMPRMSLASLASGSGNSGNQGRGDQTHIHVWSIEEAAERLAALPSMQKAVVHIVGDNPRTIQGKWGR